MTFVFRCCIERLMARRIDMKGEAEVAHATSQPDTTLDATKSEDVLKTLKERDAKREKFFPKEGVDMKLLAEGLEFKSAEEKEKEKQLRDALNGEGGKKVKDADKKKITEYMEAQDAREKWMEDLTERKEKLAADRRRRNFFGVLQYVIFRWSKPLSETHLTEKDVKEAAKAAVELDSTPDKGLLEVLVRMYASAMECKEAVQYFFSTVTNINTFVHLFIRNNTRDGIIQLVISAANLRLMGWVIAMAGFSIITVEDKFDPNQLIYFRYIFMLWLVPPISSMFLGLGLGRITVRITKLRDFFTCLIAAREPEPSDEKLTLKPVGGSSDEEWDLWDHLNHLYNDGLVSYFNQIWTTYQDKHAKLTRNRVDLSYGVATTGKNAEQAESVFDYIEKRRGIMEPGEAAKASCFGLRKPPAVKAPEEVQEEEAPTKKKGKKRDEVVKSKARNLIRDKPDAPKPAGTRVLGFTDMDWEDWQQKRLALGDESLPFWVRKLTVNDVTGLAASAAHSSPAARLFRFLWSTLVYWGALHTMWDLWVMDFFSEAKYYAGNRKNCFTKSLMVTLLLFRALVGLIVAPIVYLVYTVLMYVVVFLTALLTGFLWEIPVLASAAMVPVVLLWASLARALSAVTNFFFWYNNSVPTGFHKLDGRARAKAVIDWAQFMQTFFENGPSLIVQIIFVIINKSSRTTSIYISLASNSYSLLSVVLQFRREYSKIVMIREISKRGIEACFENPEFYRFATWNDFKLITQDLHPNGIKALTHTSKKREETGGRGETLLHKPNLPFQVYEELLSRPTTNPNAMDKEDQTPIMDHAQGSGSEISHWDAQRGVGRALRTDERQRWLQKVPAILLGHFWGPKDNYITDVNEVIRTLKDALLCMKMGPDGKSVEMRDPAAQNEALQKALDAAKNFLDHWYNNDVLSSFGEHTYVYIMGALQAIKRFYDMQDFTRKAGDPNWDKMPPHFCADVMHLVQRADDCKPPDSFLLWLFHLSGLGSELLRVPLQAPFDPFYSMDALLGHSAMVNVADENGDTPLHKARKFSQRGAACAVYRLLKFGADPWRLNKNGQTPLHVACTFLTSETPHVIRELLAYIEKNQSWRLKEYINMAEENETANTAMHKVAISAWTFTTMRTAGIDKRALPRRVRKALMIYMFMAADNDKRNFKILKVEDLKSVTRLLRDENSWEYWQLNEELEAKMETLREEQAAKVVGEPDALYLLDAEMLKVDPELDEDRVDPKFEVDRNELRWTKAVLDNASLAGATVVSEAGQRHLAKDIKRRLAEGEVVEMLGAEAAKDKEDKKSQLKGAKQSASQRALAKAGSQKGLGEEAQKGQTAAPAQQKMGEGKKDAQADADTVPEDEEEDDEDEDDEWMPEEEEEEEEEEEIDDTSLQALERKRTDLVVVESVAKGKLVIERADFDAWKKEAGVPDDLAKPEYMTEQQQEELYEFGAKRMKEREDKYKEVVEGQLRERIDPDFLKAWLYARFGRFQTPMARWSQRRLLENPSKMAKRAKLQLIDDWKKFRDGIEKSRQTVAANYKDGTSQALKRGELGGLSFTGFYSTGDTGSRENRFEYERRRYASDKDVEFLPGAATYGKAWSRFGLAWRPNMQKAMEVMTELLEKGGDLMRRNDNKQRVVDILKQKEKHFHSTFKRIVRLLVQEEINERLHRDRHVEKSVKQALKTKQTRLLNFRMALQSMAQTGILHNVTTGASNALVTDSAVVFWTQVPTCEPLRELCELWQVSREDAREYHQAFKKECNEPLATKPYELGWGPSANRTKVEGEKAREMGVKDTVDDIGEWDVA